MIFSASLTKHSGTFGAKWWYDIWRCKCVHSKYALAGLDCLYILVHLWCLHRGVTDYLCCKYVQQSFIFFFSSPNTGPSHVSWMYERENGKVFMILLDVLYVRSCERECIWIKEVFALMHPCLSGGVPFLLARVTRLLPVAGTTYKPVVIKVFDLLCLPPRDTHFQTWRTLCYCQRDQWLTEKREPQTDKLRGLNKGVQGWWGKVAGRRGEAEEVS